MSTVGILAYGSLIEDPGKEIKPLIIEWVNDIETPFPVEFARSSKSRGGAPTLIPIEGGNLVKAVILVLEQSVSVSDAKDFIWRRETRNEDTKKKYDPPLNPGPNHIIVEELSSLGGIDNILYTKIGSNIKLLTPDHLADLAICSARGHAGEKMKDGINYLLSVKRQKIVTPLSDEYEKSILKKTGTSSLEEAFTCICNGYA